MALTKTASSADAAQNFTTGQLLVGADIDISGCYDAQLIVFYATTYAGAITTAAFARVEISLETATDEWATFTELSFNTATPVTTTLNGGTTANDATFVLTSGTNFTQGNLGFILDGTAANSEWFEIKSVATNTITPTDNVLRTHATAAVVSNAAERRVVRLPFGANRARVVYQGATGTNMTSSFMTRVLKVTAV